MKEKRPLEWLSTGHHEHESIYARDKERPELPRWELERISTSYMHWRMEGLLGVWAVGLKSGRDVVLPR